MPNVPHRYAATADVSDHAEEPILPEVTLMGQRFNRNTREREVFAMILPDPHATRYSINGAVDRFDTLVDMLDYATAAKLTRIAITDHSGTYPALEILLALR